MLRNAARLEDAILELIARKRAQPAGQHDVLALLIHARDEDGTQMSDFEVIGRTLRWPAGHETTATHCFGRCCCSRSTGCSGRCGGRARR